MGAVLCALLLAALGDRNGDSIARAQTSTTQIVLELVNQVRSERGLPPYRFNQALSVAAQNQADFNATNARYGHGGEGGSRPQDRAEAAGYTGNVIENVVGGWDLTPQQGVTWWVNSPVHYNTLISTRYIDAGAGYATNGRQRHYTLVVGRPSDATDNPISVNEQPAGPPAFVEPIVISEPDADGSIIHKVMTGHTLWAIAARYNVRLTDLLLYNNLSETSLLRPGDELIVRLADGQEPPPTPTPPLSHIVRAGETLWTVAARYRLDLSELLWLNSIDENEVLQPGDALTIRLAAGQLPPPTPTPQTTHVVQAGDTAWGIAAQYGLSVDALLTLNGLNADDILRPGDTLRIVAAPRISTTPTSAREALPSPDATRSAVEPDLAEPAEAEVLTNTPSMLAAQSTSQRTSETPQPSPGDGLDNSDNVIADIALVAAVAFIGMAGILAMAMYRTR